MLVTVWKGLGYYMIIYLAALGTVSKDLHEAAQVDGAGWCRRLYSVTLPALRPTMVLVAVLSAVSAFRVFSEVYLLAGPAGGPGGADTTLVMLIQQVGTGLTGDLGYSSALSVVLFALTLGLLLLTNRLNRREDL
jgi:multiple sugar transport system permease protein